MRIMKKELYNDVEEQEVDNEDTSSNEVITQPFSPNDIEISNPPMNLGDLIDMIAYGWIDFKTEYQREEDLWSPVKQSRLIESALLGLRLPAFYFEEVSKKYWKIIDGLQRCCAIRNYCVDESFGLCDLEFLNFNGKKYSDLPFELRRDIRMLPITVNVLNKGASDKVKYILFKRLNTGGMELKPQEIRNAVFQGKAIELVKDLAGEESFKEATGHKIPIKRMENQDFVTRFMAFYLMGYERYEPDLDNFMNDCLEKINGNVFSDEKLEQMKIDFSEAMVLAKDIFGDDAFRKRESVYDKKRPINKAYFEVIAVSLAKLRSEERDKLVANKDLFKQNLIEIMKNNKSYNNSFSSGTGQRDNVKRRFSVFNDIIRKSIDNVKISASNDIPIKNLKF